MGKSVKKTCRIRIIIALIGVTGVLVVVVVFSNWGRLSRESEILATGSHTKQDSISASEDSSQQVLHRDVPVNTTTENARKTENRLQEQGTSPQPKQGDIKTNSIGINLVYIPAGSFMMGSGDSAEELAKQYNAKEEFFEREFPQHQVSISEGFWMGKTEITQAQYKSVMNTQPWSGKPDVQESANNPAVYVSWDDAVAFCRKLGKQEGKTYRLPTEAEWEYACRAGKTTRFSFGDSDFSLGDHGWFFDNTKNMGEEYAHPAGQKKPNSWTLYDMHGNVWEWCSDFYDESYYSNSPGVDPKGPASGEARCTRSGSWLNAAVAMRCSCRGVALPESRSSVIGFRVVCPH